MISRKLYEKTPLDLLLSSLRPATKIEKLSPADRVFGWVSQDPGPGGGEPAYRGQLRVGPVTCTTADAMAAIPGSKRTLAILAQPKPQQGRFYLGQANGPAGPKGRDKEAAGYGGANGSAGRRSIRTTANSRKRPGGPARRAIRIARLPVGSSRRHHST